MNVTQSKSMVETQKISMNRPVAVGGNVASGTTTVQLGTLKTVPIISQGDGYLTAPTVTIVAGAGGGSLGTVTATILDGHVSTFTITAMGTVYTGAPSLSCSGGRGLEYKMIETGD